MFEWSSCRGGMMHTITFKNGKKVKDTTKKSKKEHGCILKFSPNTKYLGKSAKIPKKGLIAWIENISYFIPKNCKIQLEIYKGMELKEKFKYKSRSISELLSSHIPETDEKISSLYTFEGSTKLEEDFRGERKIKRDLKLEFAFQYTNTIEPWIDSYCNYVNTTSGGIHLTSVQEALWRYFTKKTTETLTDKEKEKYKILKVDVEAGLNLVVNIFTDAQMQFVGQTKNEVSSDDLIDPIKQIATDALEEYFRENKNALTQITKIIKTNCKARNDLNKLKATTIKETVNKFEKHTMKNFTPCNNDGKAYKELHICEGGSAKGSLVDGRDSDTQAFLAFRGVS